MKLFLKCGGIIISLFSVNSLLHATDLLPVISGVTDSSFTVTWTNIPTANYNAVISLDNQFTTVVSSLSLSANTTGFLKLLSNTIYHFKVKLSTETDSNYTSPPISQKTLTSGSTNFAYEIVDGISSDVGEFPSMVIDRYGNMHVAYRAVGSDDLLYIKRTGNVWGSPVTVDSQSSRYTSIGIDGADNLHIAYYDLTITALKHAKYDGVSWVISTVAAPTSFSYSSLALDGAGNPHISYHPSDGTLWHAKHDGTSWILSLVDPSINVGEYSSIAVDGFGNPHISYYDKTNLDLKYAKYDGISWNLSPVDSAGDVGSFTSIALDAAGNPHISYHDKTNLNLKYAKYDGVAWSLSVPDIALNVGSFTSVALDGSGYPHISYKGNDTELSLKYANFNGVSWSTYTVNAKVGGLLVNAFHTFLSIDGSGNPHIAYRDGTYKDLKVAHWTGASFSVPMNDAQGPSGFSGNADSDSQITWGWTDNAINETRYTVYHRSLEVSNQPFSRTFLGANTSSWVQGGLKAATFYQAYMAAENPGGVATSKKIVTVFTSLKSDVSSVKAYPSPLRLHRGQKEMIFTNMTAEASVKIYTYQGELVKELTADKNGRARWNAKNSSEMEVAAGIYLALIQGAQNSEKILKIVVEK